MNYDINLFLLSSEIVSDFVGHISDGIYKETINNIDYVVVKSLFPRLCNMNISNDTYRLKIGDVLTRENIRSIRPGLGLPPKYIDVILGKQVKANIKRGTPLSWDLL